MIIKLIYTAFLGILFALFVGLGIAAFYPTPERPEYPRELETAAVQIDSAGKPLETPAETAEMKQKRLEYDEAIQKYNKEIFPVYNRNVSIITVVFAVLALVVSLSLMHKVDLISDGLLLGGALLLGYSIIRGFMSEDNVLTLFLVTAVGLVVSIFVGHKKFVTAHEK